MCKRLQVSHSYTPNYTNEYVHNLSDDSEQEQQLHQQHEFFELKLYGDFNDVRYNVYTTTMFTVLPSNASQTFRRIIHSLLVTHTEAKLNSLGHIFKYPVQTLINQSIYRSFSSPSAIKEKNQFKMIGIHCILLCLSIILFNCQLTNQAYSCSRTMTLQEIIIILKQTPCASIFRNITQHRQKPSSDAGNLDIHALQTTINDHHKIINYLINNSISATFVADAIKSHHTKTGPVLSSWRDIIDLFTITLVCGLFVYYCICRIGFGLCDKFVSCFSQPIINRVQRQQQAAPPNRKSFDKQQQRQPKPPLQSSLTSSEGYITGINHGRMSA
ncbi:hypothetical protein I4U23_023050 [Adineta vaga]|nr:hypothetical protein I4U23_023050 [Adineta vaga]